MPDPIAQDSDYTRLWDAVREATRTINHPPSYERARKKAVKAEQTLLQRGVPQHEVTGLYRYALGAAGGWL